MAKIGMFYGTDTGNTEMMAGLIKDKLEELLGGDHVDLHEIYQKEAQDVAQYTHLIIGMPTWYDGELQGDWEEYLPIWQEIDFTGKKVSFFALGDQYGYASYFCDAIGVFAEVVEQNGGQLFGCTSVEGYEHDFSKAQRDDIFVGLCLDTDNQDDMSDDRIAAWVPQIIQEMELEAHVQA